MMMKQLKRVLALGAVVCLVTSNVCGCGSIDAQAMDRGGVDEEILILQNAVDEFAGSSDIMKHSDTAGKEETVYAILDADGNPVETIVSTWLKNPQGAAEVADKTSLTDVRAVKGTAEYTKDGEGGIVWTTDGSDIYYQGKSDKEFPVDVHISYELDGRKVLANELDGANGHLKITFSYENKTAKEVVVHGETCTIYQPFLMLSGLMLDNEKASNVTVEGGSAVNNGDNTMVFGIAMPGLKESLGIDDLKDDDGKAYDLNIPEEVVVEADVTDFSLLMTLTVASNSALEELGLDNIDSIDDLKSNIDKLTDGMNEIIDGTTKLNDGAGELSDGTGKLSDGVGRLSDGAGELANGANKVSDGAAQVNEGAVAIKDGIYSLKDSTPALASGIGSLAEGANDLTGGLNTITSNSEALNGGAAQVADGLGELNAALNDPAAQEQIAGLVSGSAQFAEGLNSAAAGLSDITTNFVYDETTIATLESALEGYAAAGVIDAAVAQGMIQYLEGYKMMYGYVSGASDGVNVLAQTYGQIDGGIGAVAGNMGNIAYAVGSLSDGAGQVRDGVAGYTAGVAQAAAGVSALNEGLASLNAQVPTLVAGIEALANGADSLANGTGELSNGAKELANGANELNNGTGELRDGVSRLLDGAAQLLDGTGDLKEGVLKYNREGIQKLAELVNEDLEKYYDRFCEVKEYAKEYGSYAGCEEGVECSVKFIYKTDSIGK